MVPGIGQRIGPYEILGRLGSGGMGLVYSAWDSRLHRDVAIKILRDEYLNSTMRSRFLGEARAASRLNHPNICTIFDIGEHEGSPYIVMELLRGDTLRGRLNQGQISNEDLFRVAEDVADALSVAHHQGLIHRDIKPANIVLVDKSGGQFQTKVLDFGLAKDLDEGTSLRTGITSTGMTVGTVSYMSPEQARGELLDRRSDLFSLGVVLYEMATGQVPFVGATSALVFVHLLNDPPQPVRELNASIPRAMEQIISTCLQKDKNARFQSAEELLAALRKVKLSPVGEEKQSWLSKFTLGRKQRESAPVPLPTFREGDPVPLEEFPSRPAVSGESFIRPVKRIRTTGNQRAAENLPPSGEPTDIYPKPLPPLTSESSVRNGVRPPLAKSDLPELAPASSGASSSARPTEQKIQSATIQRLAMSAEQTADLPATAAIAKDEKVRSGERLDGKWRLIFGIILIFMAFAASVTVFLAKRPLTAAGTPITLLLGSIDNHTGDSNLSGALPVGLELALQQSPRVSLRSGVDASSGIVPGADAGDEPDEALFQRMAKAAGASAFVIGDVHNEGPTYVISLKVIDAQTGKRLGECAGTAVSRERISGAIDSLATNLRSILGESSDSIHDSFTPLSREATSNFEALKAYGSGEQLEADGRLFDAMFAYKRATTLEPQFTQAHLRLATLFRKQHAEVSAAREAARAQSSATTASTSDRTRVLAEAINAVDGEGDYAKATSLLQQLRSSHPYDLQGLDSLAFAQRLQGDFAGSLSTARSALLIAPEDNVALGEVEANLIALNRMDEALQVATKSSVQSGLRPAAEVLLALLNRGPATQAFATGQSVDDLGAQDNIAAVLDANGQFRDGLSKWREISARASVIPELASAASYAIGQGALDRALASDCAGAEALLQNATGLPTGPSALFALGSASGLCGGLSEARKSVEALNANYAQTFPVRSFYISDLNALILWKSGLGSDALVTLDSAKEYDSLSLTPYLRGLVYMAQGHPQMTNAEFQTMLRQPGLLTLLNPMIYPMAQIGAARAYRASNDPENAARAYGKLLALWPNADPDAAMVVEARTSAQ